MSVPIGFETVAETYVMYEGREYLVSTTNRSSSQTVEGYHAETRVWPVDENRERTRQEILYQDADDYGSVQTHCWIVLKIAVGQLGFQERENLRKECTDL